MAGQDRAAAEAHHGTAGGPERRQRTGTPRVAPVSGGPVFEQHRSPMLLIEPSTQRIVGANAAAVRFYGWSVWELTRISIADLNTLPPEAVEREMAAARAQRRAYFAFRHRVADGTVHDVEVYSNPIEIDGRELLATIIHEATERHQAIHGLHADEAFARAIVDFAPVGIAVADLEGRIVRANAAMSQITGYAQDALLGMDYRQLTVPDERERTATLAQQLLTQDRNAYRVEKRYLRPDGATVEVEAWSTLVRDGDGEVRFQLGVVRDLTEQRSAVRAAEQAAERLLETMESVQDAIVILDTDWRITYVNPRFEELLRVDGTDVVGQELWKGFPAVLGGGFEHAYRRAVSTGQPQTTVEHFHPTGSWYEARAFPGPEGLVVYFSDVTERVEHQERLERLAAIERTNADRYRQLDETKTAFLTAVSHELRTPLAVVSGLAETLVHRRDVLDEDVRRRIEDGLLQHSHRVIRLLDELLDVDRLSRGTLRMQRVETDVAALVRRTVAESPVAQRCQVTAPQRLVTWLDEVQFQHLLGNLLSNAEKYAPQGQVRVHLHQLSGDRIRLRVSDDGPGIAEDDRGRVFEPFVRLDEGHPQPGTGVGLTLVAEFARLHGGRARIGDGPGTTVVVDLPRGGPEPPDVQPPDA